MENSKRIVFVTGAAKGIGFAAAQKLALAGATVIIGARNADTGSTATNKLKETGLDVYFIPHDITQEKDNRRVTQFIEDKFGRLDVLINNAGILLDSEDASTFIPNNSSSVSIPILKETFETNFFGVIHLTQLVLPLMKKSQNGSIVNLSSVLGSLTLHADPASPIYEAKFLAYNASKTALNAFTLHLAHELKDTNIKVNSIHPGWVQSAMGGQLADMDIDKGSDTTVKYALLDSDGPTGGFFHFDEVLPW